MKNGFIGFKKEMRLALDKEFGKLTAPFWGSQKAKIVSVSQAPSLSVIKNQKPFSDKSGEKLRKEWYCLSDEDFYNPDNFYFTAIGMYFPGKDKNGNDKKPDFKWANKWLREELSFLNPELYLIIGRVATGFFFPKNDFSGLVFKNQKLNNKTALVLPHPSPLNIKWFKDNPDFKNKRLRVIKKFIRKALNKT